MDRLPVARACHVALLALAVKWIWLFVLIFGARTLLGVDASVSEAQLPAWGLTILSLATAIDRLSLG